MPRRLHRQCMAAKKKRGGASNAVRSDLSLGTSASALFDGECFWVTINVERLLLGFLLFRFHPWVCARMNVRLAY